MKKNNFIGIKLIGWFQVFGALVLLLTLNVEQNPPFNIRFSMPFVPEILMKIVVIVMSLIIAYEYLKQTKYGYWSMIIYSTIFCCISLIQSVKYGMQPFIGNTIYSSIVVIYTIVHRKYF